MSNSRVVYLDRYRSDGQIKIVRNRNGKRIEHTYYPQARSEHRLNAVLQEGSAAVDISSQSVDVSVYFYKPVRLRSYRPPYWEKGWRHVGTNIVWDHES